MKVADSLRPSHLISPLWDTLKIWVRNREGVSPLLGTTGMSTFLSSADTPIGYIMNQFGAVSAFLRGKGEVRHGAVNHTPLFMIFSLELV